MRLCYYTFALRSLCCNLNNGNRTPCAPVASQQHSCCYHQQQHRRPQNSQLLFKISGIRSIESKLLHISSCHYSHIVDNATNSTCTNGDATNCSSGEFNTLTEMPCRNWTDDIEYLNRKCVHIKDAGRVNKILDTLVTGGADRLHAVFDFDRTITKHHVNGEPQPSSFSIFSQCPSLPAHYKEGERNLCNKYSPIEMDPNIPVEDKRGLMAEWWDKSEALLKGIKFNMSDIDDVVQAKGPQIRDGCNNAFKLLEKRSVPVLVFSAGLGNCVESVLRKNKINSDNVKIVSNFLKFDDDGALSGFDGELIHVFNKNEYALKGTAYQDMIAKRDCVIVMGDSIGDASMVEGMTASAVLKIGLLSGRVEESLPQYMDAFDIVIVEDQTMDLLNILLEHIL